MGKSFEIRPTGVAHADLLLPEDWEPSYPKYKSSVVKNKVVEHYSWKKVTTNISGFILGSPTIDHYGDMVVCTNVPLRRYQAHPLLDHQPQDQGPVYLNLQTTRLARTRCVRDIWLRH